MFGPARDWFHGGLRDSSPKNFPTSKIFLPLFRRLGRVIPPARYRHDQPKQASQSARRSALTCINHSFLKKLFFTERTEVGHRVHGGDHAVLLRVLFDWAPCPR